MTLILPHSRSRSAGGLALQFVTALTLSMVLLDSPAWADSPPATGPVFKDGEAQIVEAMSDPDFWIRHDLWVETEFDSDADGQLDRMHVDVTRPQQTDTEGLKLPIIYVTSPYFAGTGASGQQYFWDVKQELNAPPPTREHFPPVKLKSRRPIISKSHVADWVPRGFIVVHSSSPGTGLSQGCPTVGGDNESLAPKAVVDWLNGRAKGFTSPDGSEPVEAYWSTGKVGMTGTSYNGTLPLAAATTGVDGLEAIIPIAPNTSYYHYYRSNGLVRHPGGYLGEDIDYLYDFIHSHPSTRREYCDCEIRDREMLEGMDRESGDYNDFWAGRDYLNDLGPLKAAVLMAHGFNDWNVVPEHSNRISQALKEKGVPVQIYYHQAGHGGEPPMKLMNRWFTRYLHGVENNVEQDPRAWIVREGDKPDAPTSYEDYPNPLAQPVTWHLRAGAPGVGGLTTENLPVQGVETLVDNYSFAGDALAQADWTEHRLLFTTPPLEKEVHISGTPRITVKLSSDRTAANLSVWLVSLPWNSSRQAKITDNIITRGWADPQNHRSITEGAPLFPGTFYEVSFDLQPDDQIIPKGQQIGLLIFSSDRDFTLHPKPGTQVTVDLDGTQLLLPIVGGKQAVEEAFTADAEQQP
ncbi:Xaa-Pro dipeptidyl-peptidase [Aureliella helgolandensis]|uniref:Xaa-Pro dipeptidyl-peptidase n=1 Tax=Aureliella helgolandensis TaxID=2527968 RepID=A0A518G6V1_9BACT|nr:Xaa-Pro dipeptidyl-peptidase [Aureliella helgolandensis]QDV24306.1 Xaa-Pro dipeptidyl-peptidase [Aureliella helgolandensis]